MSRKQSDDTMKIEGRAIVLSDLTSRKQSPAPATEIQNCVTEFQTITVCFNVPNFIGLPIW